MSGQVFSGFAALYFEFLALLAMTFAPWLVMFFRKYRALRRKGYNPRVALKIAEQHLK